MGTELFFENKKQRQFLDKTLDLGSNKQHTKAVIEEMSCLIENLKEKLSDQEYRCKQLENEKIAINELLIYKNYLNDEIKSDYYVTKESLELEIDRLRSEKNRLIEKLNLSDDKREMLDVEENEIADLNIQLENMKALYSAALHENKKFKIEFYELQIEMEEMKDNYVNDQYNELVEVKKKLENSLKLERISQFKIRKAEKKIELLVKEKNQIENKLYDEMAILKNHVVSNQKDEYNNMTDIYKLNNELSTINEKLNEVKKDNGNLVCAVKFLKSKLENCENRLLNESEALKEQIDATEFIKEKKMQFEKESLSKLNALEKEIQSKNQIIIFLQSMIEEQSAIIQKFKLTEKELKEKIELEEIRNDNFKNENESLHFENKNYSAKIEELVEELRISKNEISNLILTNSDLSNFNQMIDDKIHIFKNKLKLIIAKNISLNAKNELNEKAFDEYKMQVKIEKEKTDFSENEHRNQILLLNSEIISVNKEIECLKLECLENQKIINNIKKSNLLEKNSFEKIKTELENKYKTAEDLLEKKEKEIVILNKDILTFKNEKLNFKDENKLLKKDITNFKEELKSLKDKLKENEFDLLLKNDELKTGNSSIKNISTELSNYKLKIEEMKTSNDKNLNDILIFKNERDELKKLNDSLTETNKIFEGKLKFLESESNKEKKELANLKDELSNSTSQYNQISKDNLNLKFKLEEQVARCQKLDDKGKTNMKTIKDLEDEKCKLIDSKKSLLEENKLNIAKFDKANAQIENNKTLNKKIEELEKQNVDSNSKICHNEQLNKSLNSTIEKLELTNKHNEEKSNSIINDLMTSKLAETKLQEETKKIKFEKCTFETKIKEMEGTLSRSNKQTDAERIKYNKINEENQILKAQLNTSNLELTKISQNLKKAQDDLESIKNQNKKDINNVNKIETSLENKNKIEKIQVKTINDPIKIIVNGHDNNLKSIPNEFGNKNFDNNFAQNGNKKIIINNNSKVNQLQDKQFNFIENKDIINSSNKLKQENIIKKNDEMKSSEIGNEKSKMNITSTIYFTPQDLTTNDDKVETNSLNAYQQHLHSLSFPSRNTLVVSNFGVKNEINSIQKINNNKINEAKSIISKKLIQIEKESK